MRTLCCGVLAFVVAAVGLAACGNGAASPPAAVPVNVAATSKLQLGVGTATINTPNGAVVGTNFTMTFRGPDGNNATGVNTPTLTGPPNFRIGFPGSLNSLHGYPQLAFANDVAAKEANPMSAFPTPALVTSIGPYVGVFGYGMAKDNQVSSQLTASVSKLYSLVNGGALPCTDVTTVLAPGASTGALTDGLGGPTGTAESVELQLPLGIYTNNSATCPNEQSVAGSNPAFLNTSFPISYYGGPPAWPSPQGYGAPTFFTGFALGFTDSPAAPVAGMYTLDVAYATTPDFIGSAHVDATAQLRSVAPLPVMPMPSFRIAGDGSGIVSITIPPGLFESIVEVTTGSCLPNNNSGGVVQTQAFNNFSQVVRTSGTQSVVFAPNLGPPDSTGAPSKTFCSSAAQATVSVLGFDYPAYESSYPFDMSPAPKITNGDGHTGQADVTTSPPLFYNSNVNALMLRTRANGRHK